MSIDRSIIEDFSYTFCHTASGNIENYNDVNQVDYELQSRLLWIIARLIFRFAIAICQV